MLKTNRVLKGKKKYTLGTGEPGGGDDTFCGATVNLKASDACGAE